MKTREDFVSNSSSASFIVKSTQFNVTSLLLELLSKSTTVLFYADPFSKELLLEVDKSDEYDVLDDTAIEVSHERFSFEQNDTEKLYEKILAETREIECDFGLDDCGQYTGMMSQIGMLFELMGYDVEESGETSYASIKKLHLQHLDEILK